MLQGGLQQNLDKVVVEEQGASGDDWAGDVDIIDRQDVDQSLRRPGRIGQLARETHAQVMLGVGDDTEKQLVQHLADQGRQSLAGGVELLAKGDEGVEQPGAIGRIAAARQGHQMFETLHGDSSTQYRLQGESGRPA